MSQGPTLEDLGDVKAESEKKPAPKKTPTTKKPAAKKTIEEKFFLVKVPEKARENDLDFIPVGVNGEVLQLQCGSEVVLPERFLFAMDNAMTPVYKKDPEGGDRKIVGMVKKINYSKIREAKKEEFDEMKKKGALSKKR
jgi:hypothetical protein